MPANTPRGYTYPLYSDTQNFPAQIQDLAQDIDQDVQDLYDDVNGARNAPTATVFFGGPVAIPNGVTTNVIWNTEIYDNAAMWDAGTPTDISIPEVGNYLITAWIQFDVAPAGTLGIFVQSAGGFIPAPCTQTKTVDNDKMTELSVTCLTRCTATSENITLGVRQSVGGPLNLNTARMTVTKVSP